MVPPWFATDRPIEGSTSGISDQARRLMSSMPWTMITVPSPSTPTAVPFWVQLSGGGSQVHSVSAQVPVHTLPGSLGLAGDVLFLFVALLFS